VNQRAYTIARRGRRRPHTDVEQLDSRPRAVESRPWSPLGRGAAALFWFRSASACAMSGRGSSRIWLRRRAQSSTPTWRQRQGDTDARPQGRRGPTFASGACATHEAVVGLEAPTDHGEEDDANRESRDHRGGRAPSPVASAVAEAARSRTTMSGIPGILRSLPRQGALWRQQGRYCFARHPAVIGGRSLATLTDRQLASPLT